MDLILWRHARAQDPHAGMADMDRALTPDGQRQARRMAAWLHARLPPQTRVLCSPAVRTRQTAQALPRPHALLDALRPDGSAEGLLQAVDWPHAGSPVLVVGHQPVLGQAIAHLLGMNRSECPVKKGAVWWLRHRQREGQWQTVVMAVLGDAML